MTADEVSALIRAHIAGEVIVTTKDQVHFEAWVVSEAFTSLSRIKRQQMVYAALGNAISDGHVHALALKTLTPEEAQPNPISGGLK